MKLIETTVTDTAVRMRYADNSDAAKATQWIDFQFPIEQLTGRHPQDPIGEPDTRLLALIRRAALQHAQNIISGESQRLVSLANNERY